jgi:hypothetical protein
MEPLSSPYATRTGPPILPLAYIVMILFFGRSSPVVTLFDSICFFLLILFIECDLRVASVAPFQPHRHITVFNF